MTTFDRCINCYRKKKNIKFREINRKKKQAERDAIEREERRKELLELQKTKSMDWYEYYHQKTDEAREKLKKDGFLK
jgi:hypothetical protein